MDDSRPLIGLVFQCVAHRRYRLTKAVRRIGVTQCSPISPGFSRLARPFVTRPLPNRPGVRDERDEKAKMSRFVPNGGDEKDKESRRLVLRPRFRPGTCARKMCRLSHRHGVRRAEKPKFAESAEFGWCLRAEKPK